MTIGHTLLGGDEGDGAQHGGREGVGGQAHARQAVQQLHAVVDALLVQAQGAAQGDQAPHGVPPPHAAVLVSSRLARQRVAVLKLLHRCGKFFRDVRLQG